MYIFQASKAEIVVDGSVSLLKLPRGFDFRRGKQGQVKTRKLFQWSLWNSLKQSINKLMSPVLVEQPEHLTWEQLARF